MGITFQGETADQTVRKKEMGKEVRPDGRGGQVRKMKRGRI